MKNRVMAIVLLSLLAAIPHAYAQSLPECSNDDLVLSSVPGESVAVLGCSGAISSKGGDPYKEATTAGWLQNVPYWQDNILTNSGTETSTYNWSFLTKYAPNGTIEAGSTLVDPVFDLNFTCRDSSGADKTCTDNDLAFDLDITFASSDPADLMYNQFVFLAKASNYYSLYQVSVLEGIETLTGSLNMVSQNGLSHLSVWAANTGSNPSIVAVSAPTSLGIMFAGLVFLMRKRQRSTRR